MAKQADDRNALYQLRRRFPWRPRYEPEPSQPLIKPCVADEHPAFEREFGAIRRILQKPYARFDREALREQYRYRFNQTWLIVFGLLATAAGGLQSVEDLAEPMGIAEALLGVVLLALATQLRRRGAQRRYVQARLAAERLRGEAFLYLMGAGPYDGKDADAREALLDGRVSMFSDATTASGSLEPAAPEPRPTPGLQEGSREQSAYEIYRVCRLDDQRSYYGRRRLEYERATRAAGWIGAGLSVLTVGIGVLTAILGEDATVLVSVIATAIPALGTALAAYTSLFGFERLSKLYGDAEAALGSLADSLGSDPSEVVAEAEEVMRREQGQWGQFADEPPVTPGSA